MAVLALSGCGDDSRQTSEAGVSASAPAGQVEASSPTSAAAEATSDKGESVQESGLVLDVGLKDGRFSSETPPEFSVPDGVPVILRFEIADDVGYDIDVVGPGGKSLPLEFDSAATRDVVFGNLEAGETVLVRLGDDELKIVGGAEVGP